MLNITVLLISEMSASKGEHFLIFKIETNYLFLIIISPNEITECTYSADQITSLFLFYILSSILTLILICPHSMWKCGKNYFLMYRNLITYSHSVKWGQGEPPFVMTEKCLRRYLPPTDKCVMEIFLMNLIYFFFPNKIKKCF